MPLTTCPDCEGSVSDQASVCPHCGFPMSEQRGADAGELRPTTNTTTTTEPAVSQPIEPDSEPGTLENEAADRVTAPKRQRIWEGTLGTVLELLSVVVALLASTWFLTDLKGVPWTPEGFLDAFIRTRFFWDMVQILVVFWVTLGAGMLLIAVVGMIEIVVLPPRTDTPDHEQQDREQRENVLAGLRMWSFGLAGYVVVVALVTLVIAALIAIPLLIMGDLGL